MCMTRSHDITKNQRGRDWNLLKRIDRNPVRGTTGHNNTICIPGNPESHDSQEWRYRNSCNTFHGHILSLTITEPLVISKGPYQGSGLMCQMFIHWVTQALSWIVMIPLTWTHNFKGASGRANAQLLGEIVLPTKIITQIPVPPFLVIRYGNMGTYATHFVGTTICKYLNFMKDPRQRLAEPA